MSKCFSLSEKKRYRAVLIRSGGMGDFILTLPLLDYLQNSYREVLLITKPEYFVCVDHKVINLEVFDLNLGVNSISKEIKDSDVYTFWDDTEWRKELKEWGAQDIFILNSRPSSPPHIVESMFKAIEVPIYSSFLSKAWLGDKWNLNSLLWIHPGSGGKNKNMPVSFYKELANRWVQKKDFNKVTFCFGEADQALLYSFQKEMFLKPNQVRFVQPSSINHYKKLLLEGVAEFWGNDSGPSHLAANLGLPTNVCFRSTTPAIWRPTGPRVHIHEFTQEPDSN